MVNALIVVGLVVVMLCGVAATAAFVAKMAATPVAQDPPRTPDLSALHDLATRLAALEVTVQDLPPLWEEQVRRAANHSKRAQDAERRAAEIGEESQDVEFSDPELLTANAPGGHGQGVLPLHGHVAGPIDPDLQARADAVLAQGF